MLADAKVLHPYGSIIRLFGAWLVFFAWISSGVTTESYKDFKRDVQETRAQVVFRYVTQRLENQKWYDCSAAPDEASGNHDSASTRVDLHEPKTRRSSAFGVREEDIRALAMLMSDIDNLSRSLAAPDQLRRRVEQTATAIQTEAPRLTRAYAANDPELQRPRTPEHQTDFESSLGTSIRFAKNEKDLLTEFDELSTLLEQELARRQRVATVANRIAVLLYVLGTILAVYGEWLRRPAVAFFGAK